MARGHCFAPPAARVQTVKKVLSSRHVRMDRTHTGKFSTESVRAALRRVRGSALNFVPRDCEAEARPADETAEAEQGQRSAFCKPAATGAAKAGNRNHQGERISAARLRAEMGSPEACRFRHAKQCGGRLCSRPPQRDPIFRDAKVLLFWCDQQQKEYWFYSLCRHIGWVFYPSVQVVSGTCAPLISSPGMVPRGCYK